MRGDNMSRKTFKKKGAAKKAKKRGQRVYKVRGGWRIGKAGKKKKGHKKKGKKKRR